MFWRSLTAQTSQCREPARRRWPMHVRGRACSRARGADGRSSSAVRVRCLVHRGAACLQPAPVVARYDRKIPKCDVLLVNYQRLVCTICRRSPAWVRSEPCAGHSRRSAPDEARTERRMGIDMSAISPIWRCGATSSRVPRPLSIRATSSRCSTSCLAPPGDEGFCRAARATGRSPRLCHERIFRGGMQPLFVRTQKDELGLDDPIIPSRSCAR